MVKRKLQQLCAVAAVVTITHGYTIPTQRSFARPMALQGTPNGPAEYAVRLSDASSFVSTQQREEKTTVVLPSSYTPSPSTQSFLQDTALPVLSAALLITGNTVGAGCLVLPELAVGPGLQAVTGMYVVAWALNLLTGLVLAEVALTQRERVLSSTEKEEDALPSASFQDFAAAHLGSKSAAHVVAGLSLFINACVLAFDFSRVGVLGAGLGLDACSVSITSAAAVGTALATLSTPHLSLLCNVAVAALFASYAGLLLPGLASVPDLAAVWAVPGTALDFSSSLSSTFPIILMSMVFQNIVPVVVKFLHYDRAKSVAAITLGSLIPLTMYTAWCFCCLGGGVDLAGGATPLVTLFSVATLAGSSLCTSMSLTEEVTTVLRCLNLTFPAFHSETTAATAPVESTRMPPAHSTAAALTAVTLPLVAALTLEGDDGLTVALAIAGSFGSPLLYGVIPALMAWRQRQSHEAATTTTPLQPSQQYWIPSATLPVLGALSTGFVGQELWARLGDVVAVAS